MFRPFKLEDLYAYAQTLGFTADDVIVVEETEDDYAYVWFGDEYGESWTWDFDDGLDSYATEYEHCESCD